MLADEPTLLADAAPPTGERLPCADDAAARLNAEPTLAAEPMLCDDLCMLNAELLAPPAAGVVLAAPLMAPSAPGAPYSCGQNLRYR